MNKFFLLKSGRILNLDDIVCVLDEEECHIIYFKLASSVECCVVGKTEFSEFTKALLSRP